MASSRRAGTNESRWTGSTWESGVNTFGGTGYGRDYTTMGSWEDATDVNVVSAEVCPVLECYDDTSPYTQQLQAAQTTANATYHRIVRAASTCLHDGDPASGVKFTNTASWTLYLSEPYIQAEDLVYSMALNSGNNRSAVYAAVPTGASYNSFIGLISIDSTNAGAGEGYGYSLAGYTSSNPSYTVNCISIDADDQSFYFNLGDYSTGSYLYNCTSIGGTYGVLCQNTHGVAAKNVLVSGASTEGFINNGYGILAKTNCASSDGSATDTGSFETATNCRASQSFTFESGTDNYHLASNDGGAKDYGTSLAADGTFAFDDDIDFETRSGSWDIGFDEYVSGVTTQYGTATITGTGSLSATGFKKAFATSTITGTGTLTGIGRVTRFGTSTLSGTGGLSAAGQRITYGSATLTGASTLTAAGYGISYGTAALSGSADLSAVAIIAALGSATITGTADLTASAWITALGSSTLSGTGNLSAAGYGTTYGTATLSGTGTLSATGAAALYGSATLAASGTLSATAIITALGTSTLSGTGNLTASAWIEALGSATLSASGTLTASGFGLSYGSATLSGLGTLTATGAAALYGTCTLSGTGVLTATGLQLSYGSATLAANGTLTATGLLTTFGTSTLTGTAALTASAWITALGSGTLTGLGTLSADGQAIPPAGTTVWYFKRRRW